MISSCLLFFFQAEDGIRDHCVNGVQTCALPISRCHASDNICSVLPHQTRACATLTSRDPLHQHALFLVDQNGHRSEERRVGKECRSRWSTYHQKKKHKLGSWTHSG